MKKNFAYLLLAFGLLFQTNIFAQPSYEEFHDVYKPHYKKLVSSSTVIDTYEGLGDGSYGVGILYLLGEIEKDADIKLNLSTILTSADRNKVAKGLEGLSTANAVTALGYMKDEWHVELLYFVSKEVYQNVAPHLAGMRNFKAGSTESFFKKEVKRFGLLYAGLGLDVSWSGLKGMNTYVDAYNGWPSKGNTPVYTLSEELNKAGIFKGFNLGAGIKLSENHYLNANVQRRSTVSSGGGESPSVWTKDLKFSMTTINLDFMKMMSSGFISTAGGFGIQYNMGGMKERNSINTPKYQKVGGTSNFGAKYAFSVFVNPEKLPVMFELKPYLQMNFTKMDFTEFETKSPQLAWGGGESEDLLSTVATLGVQFNVNYKFGGVKTNKTYISFEDELVANMDKSLNTVYSELVPRVSPDGKTMYFVRADHPLNTKGTINSQDIWVSDVSNGLESATATHMKLPFNKAVYNSIVGVSPDENSLIINGAYEADGSVVGGYSVLYRTKDGWTNPKKLDIKDYRSMSKGNYSGAYWTQDGKHLVLSLSESSTDDLQDLYVSHLLEDGTYSKPKSLGKGLNTDNGEHSPFLASDGKTLYYSSNMSGGEGDYDIWMTKRLDDSWTKWSKPENLGNEINTENFDAYYTIDAQGKYAYMVSSNNSVGKEDIVRIKLAEEVQPDPVVLVKGIVYDAKTKLPIEANIAYNGLEDGVNYGIARTNPATGAYKIVLPYGKTYDFSANANGFIGVSSNLDLTGVGEYKEIERDLYLVPIEVGSTIRLNNIFFEVGKSELKKESYSELNRVVKILNENPKMSIELSGHTDNVGNAGLNTKLSKARASSCRDYLVAQGIAVERLEAKGYGMDKPVADNGTEEGRALNRRVEFTILGVE